ncbi:hypothetical protein Hanom_Chr02g00142381 [Helianthus anomalus]
MEPIKSNQLSNQYPPLDLAENKSQPLKLIKITSLMAVQSSFLGLHIFLPMFSPIHAMWRFLAVLKAKRLSSSL